MKEHDATEIAYKNGYKQGFEDAMRKMVKMLKATPLWFVDKDTIYQIAKEILEEDYQ